MEVKSKFHGKLVSGYTHSPLLVFALAMRGCDTNKIAHAHGTDSKPPGAFASPSVDPDKL
jgi:hypothetical protein